MRTTGSAIRIVAWALAAVFITFPGCSKKDVGPKGGGVFYQKTASEFVPLFQGSSVEMLARAVPIAGVARPSFLVKFPNTQTTEVRIGVELADGKDGVFQRVDVTSAPVEGQKWIYTVTPTADLPPGLCAIVVGVDDQLSADKNNVYPFTIVGDKPAPK